MHTLVATNVMNLYTEMLLYIVTLLYIVMLTQLIKNR